MKNCISTKKLSIVRTNLMVFLESSQDRVAELYQTARYMSRLDSSRGRYRTEAASAHASRVSDVMLASGNNTCQ